MSTTPTPPDHTKNIPPDDDRTVVVNDADRTVVLPPTPRADAKVENISALPVGVRLFEFEIIGLIGEGGFGIVYKAHDHSLDRDIAIKEYMPSSLASRSAEQTV